MSPSPTPAKVCTSETCQEHLLRLKDKEPEQTFLKTHTKGEQVSEKITHHHPGNTDLNGLSFLTCESGQYQKHKAASW